MQGLIYRFSEIPITDWLPLKTAVTVTISVGSTLITVTLGLTNHMALHDHVQNNTYFFYLFNKHLIRGVTRIVKD